ncbi:hypothetical protein CRI94_07585 [Longibacter salinarum]|uniref:N-acetyltransferase domain-containing protein n=1 Tax=Longibacter salinarum TaxID=1850348 RepID=A0A2A8CYV4_9BACT|nr:GNAT family N-acetyltransferase [Longibacter salinarum]PEN13909.1 hypothetical protein CRI94_07585 [Longibacter salinarum]
MSSFASFPPTVFQGSGDLRDWLRETGASLALALPRYNRLAVLRSGATPQKQSSEAVRDDERHDSDALAVSLHTIETPMKLRSNAERLFVSTRHQMHEFTNVLSGDATYQGHDSAYILRRSHTTGAIGAHDLGFGVDGVLRFVTARYNAVAGLDDVHSFRLRWQLSDLREELLGSDARLTGMAYDADDRPRFAAVEGIQPSSNDSTSTTGGIVDVASGDILASQLDAPQHPQCYDGKLFFVTRGDRSLWWNPTEPAGEPKRIATLPGYPVDMDVLDGCAIVSISATPPDRSPKENGTEASHHAQGDDLRNGLCVVDLSTGDVIAETHVADTLGPISGVCVLDDALHPTVLTADDDELRRTITFATDQGAVYHRLPDSASSTSGDKTEAHAASANAESTPTSAAPAPFSGGSIDQLDLDLSEARRRDTRVRAGQPYQLFAGQMLAKDVISRFQELLPGRFVRRVKTGAVSGDLPLVGVVAVVGKRPIGIAVAAIPSNASASTLHALSVLPAQRGQGVGTALLQRLEALIQTGGAEELQAEYRQSNSSRQALERVLEKSGWDAPRAKRKLYQGDRENIPKPFLETLAKRSLQAGELFSWSDLTTQEKQNLQGRLRPGAERSIPVPLSPFQLDATVDYDCSLGLRHEDRVVGWMITHRLAPEVLQYTCLYVEPDIRGPGVGLSLLAEAMRRQAERTDIPRFIWMIDAENTRMHRFVEGRLASVIDKQDTLLHAVTRF